MIHWIDPWEVHQLWHPKGLISNLQVSRSFYWSLKPKRQGITVQLRIMIGRIILLRIMRGFKGAKPPGLKSRQLNREHSSNRCDSVSLVFRIEVIMIKISPSNVVRSCAVVSKISLKLTWLSRLAGSRCESSCPAVAEGLQDQPGAHGWGHWGLQLSPGPSGGPWTHHHQTSSRRQGGKTPSQPKAIRAQ